MASASGEHCIRYRTLGRTGWNVSEIGYGMWGVGGWAGSAVKESVESLQRSVELGRNFFDTAWAYGEGHVKSFSGRFSSCPVPFWPGFADTRWDRTPTKWSQ